MDLIGYGSTFHEKSFFSSKFNYFIIICLKPYTNICFFKLQEEDSSDSDIEIIPPLTEIVRSAKVFLRLFLFQLKQLIYCLLLQLKEFVRRRLLLHNLQVEVVFRLIIHYQVQLKEFVSLQLLLRLQKPMVRINSI